MSRSKVVALTAGILMVLSSGVAWLMYMANGIAYGSILGLPGRDADRKTFLFRAETSLIAAVMVQAIGISLITSVVITRLPSIGENRMLRIAIPIALGLLSSVLVFTAIRGG